MLNSDCLSKFSQRSGHRLEKAVCKPHFLLAYICLGSKYWYVCCLPEIESPYIPEVNENKVTQQCEHFLKN